jgi:hypothetical protein
MKLRGLFFTLVASSVYSCGSTQDSKSSLVEAPSLPVAAIIAVQDDADGDQGAVSDDLRTLSSRDVQAPADQLQEQELPKLYDKAQKSETIVTQQQEVIADTGVHGWFHYRRCPGQLVRLVEVNQQEPVVLDSCQAYQVYQPAYILRGRAHRFFFHRAYKLRNVTYYYYVNQAPEQKIATQSTKQTQETEQKQQPEEMQAEKQIEQKVEQTPEQKPECQKQVPTQKGVPVRTSANC